MGSSEARIEKQSDCLLLNSADIHFAETDLIISHVDVPKEGFVANFCAKPSTK